MSLLSDLKKFALRGNLIDMAIGFTVGAAFTTIAKSLVNDIIMPPVGLLMGSSDFSDLFLVLKEGSKAAPYTTLSAAQSAGAVTVNYGVFINNIIAFLLVTLVMFAVVRLVNSVDEQLDQQFNEPPPEPGEPTEKKCSFCRTVIPVKATRCPACTSELD